MQMIQNLPKGNIKDGTIYWTNSKDAWLWHSLLAWLKSTLPEMDDCYFASCNISCVSLTLVHDHFHFRWNVFGSLLCIAYFCESSKNEKNKKFNEDILVFTILMICWITYSCSSLNGIEKRTGRGAKTKAAFISGWYIITFKLTVPCKGKEDNYTNPKTNTKTITVHSIPFAKTTQQASSCQKCIFNTVWWCDEMCIVYSSYIVPLIL